MASIQIKSVSACCIFKRKKILYKTTYKIYFLVACKLVAQCVSLSHHLRSSKSLKQAESRIQRPTLLHHRRHNGQYQGCFSKSHWGKRRVSDKWDVLVQQAPNLSKQVSEVPNLLRPVLGIKAHQLKLLLSLLLLLFFFEPASIYIGHVAAAKWFPICKQHLHEKEWYVVTSF